MSRPKVLALVPNFSEGGKIEGVLSRFTPGLVDEVLVVDDGSVDGSLEKIREIVRASPFEMTLIEHGTNRGIGAVLRTAIDYARAHGYVLFTVLAGNGKDNPQEIPKLLQPLIEENFDYVQGSRFLSGGVYDNLPLGRRLAILGFAAVLRKLTGFPITDSTNGFRAYRLSIFDDPRINIWQPWLDRYELETYLQYLVLKLGFKVKEIAISKIYPEQLRGHKRVSYTKIKPITGWWSILRPIFLLTVGLKK